MASKPEQRHTMPLSISISPMALFLVFSGQAMSQTQDELAALQRELTALHEWVEPE